MNKKITATVSSIPIIIILIVIGSFVFVANGQSQTTGAATNGAATKKPLPVLLIHGYGSDKSVWSKWEEY